MRPVWSVKQLVLRSRLRLVRAEADCLLAEGVDPWGNPVLMLRAEQLCSWPARRRFAATMDAAVAIVDRGWDSRPGLRVRRQPLQSRRDLFLAVAARLREPAPVPVAALARVSMLLEYKKGPLYPGGRTPDQLDGDLGFIMAALWTSDRELQRG